VPSLLALKTGVSKDECKNGQLTDEKFLLVIYLAFARYKALRSCVNTPCDTAMVRNRITRQDLGLWQSLNKSTSILVTREQYSGGDDR
jgi:hypothetical protein